MHSKFTHNLTQFCQILDQLEKKGFPSPAPVLRRTHTHIPHTALLIFFLLICYMFTFNP
ncbi:hypothetical protein Hanom_Chr14g01321761 [Helianthus anomalus]